MCISEEVSILSFTICSLSCIYLFKRNNKNDRWIAIFFGYLGIMQFLEYLMWKDQECSGLNQYATDLAFLHGIFQPVLSILIAYYFTNGRIPFYIYIIFFLYITTTLPEFIKLKKDNQCSLPCGKDSIGLSWKFANSQYSGYIGIIFCLAASLPFLLMEKQGIIYAGLIISTYILAYFISLYRCPNSVYPPNGSLWCIMATLIPVIAIKIND